MYIANRETTTTTKVAAGNCYARQRCYNEEIGGSVARQIYYREGIARTMARQIYCREGIARSMARGTAVRG